MSEETLEETLEEHKRRLHDPRDLEAEPCCPLCCDCDCEIEL